MKYENVTKGVFIDRPNRFIANVEIDGEIKVCHVKNTGRCKEILVKGATVILEKSNNPNRKTEFDLIGVYKGKELINIDSIAPNKVFFEWIKKENFSAIFTTKTQRNYNEITTKTQNDLENLIIRPEKTYKNSRFDFYIESGERKIFVEVKGVTLEEGGVVRFPDAPTERGIKHINELIDAWENGFEAYIFFVVQMKNCLYFEPDAKTHKEFADTLKNAYNKGVEVKCVNCNVWEDGLEIDDFIEVKL